MYFTSRRTLVQAIAFSLLIHVVLLLSVVSLVPVRLDSPATTIRVVMNRGSQRDLAKQGSEPAPKPLISPVQPPAPVVRNLPAQQRVVADTSPSASSVPLAQPVTPATGPTLQSSPGPTVAAGTGPASAPVTAREGVNADDMRQYRLSLATAARRFKRYPPLARERGWEGTTDVALNVSALLPVPEIVLLRSSGRSLLDEQALEMMDQAARVTRLPEGLKGRDFRVLLPVKFSLEED